MEVEAPKSSEKKKPKPAATSTDDTAAVANSLLQKYLRRGRR
jgi:hypothetical protein